MDDKWDGRAFKAEGVHAPVGGAGRDGDEAGEVSGPDPGFSLASGVQGHLCVHTSLWWQLLSDRWVCCGLNRVPQKDMLKF